MCTREMTLGEEIISLTGKGVDIPTVERMYRKYIAIISDADTKKVTEELYHVDVNALFPTIEAIFGKVYSILPDDISISDQIEIPLGDLGTFTATVQMVKDDKVLFLFDDYIVKRPMNENGSNEEMCIRDRIIVPRYQCVGCRCIRRYLPDYIYPYKQYESEIIDGVIEGLITCDTVGFEDYPCELTMIRWKTQNIQLPL